MALSLATAFRILPRRPVPAGAGGPGIGVAFVGAGGKTTSIFSLARELPFPSIVTTTTHLGDWQLEGADAHLVAESAGDISTLGQHKITVVTGPAAHDHRLTAVSADVLSLLRQKSLDTGWPLLIEADGARQRLIKAPGQDEPQIPYFVELAVVVAGMATIGKPLDEESTHRVDRVTELSGLARGTAITAEAIARVLTAPDGGLKGVPDRARRIALLNQADTSDLQAQAHRIAKPMLDYYDAVVVATASQNSVHAAVEPIAGIILAAGGAARFGEPKQLLRWHGEPLIRTAILAAISAGLSPIIVVTGAHAAQVERAIARQPITPIRNARWREGQSTSIVAGLGACPPATAAAVFLLADQPHVTPEVIRALIDVHSSESVEIVAPLVQGDRRGNPVLFDRETFPDLQSLRGDTGGREVFSKHSVRYLTWHDERILLDIDTPEDYRRLIEEDAA
jgi:molybdenum cofactor cytidylyltransferase